SSKLLAAYSPPAMPACRRAPILPRTPTHSVPIQYTSQEPNVSSSPPRLQFDFTHSTYESNPVSEAAAYYGRNPRLKALTSGQHNCLAVIIVGMVVSFDHGSAINSCMALQSGERMETSRRNCRPSG